MADSAVVEKAAEDSAEAGTVAEAVVVGLEAVEKAVEDLVEAG